MKLRSILFTALALAAGTAMAADTGFYVGAGVGYGKTSLPQSKLTNGVESVFATNPVLPLFVDTTTWSAHTNEKAFLWSATVGYRFMKYLAVETGYMDLGTATYKGSGTAYDSNENPYAVSAKLDWSASGVPLSVLGIWPIDNTWEVFGRAGAFFASVNPEAHVSVDYGTGKGHVSSNTTEFIGGAGVDAKFLDAWTARFEWLIVPSLGDNKTGSADWNALQFSLLYKF